MGIRQFKNTNNFTSCNSTNYGICCMYDNGRMEVQFT